MQEYGDASEASGEGRSARVKKWVLRFGLMAVCVESAWAAAPGRASTLDGIARLSHGEASQHRPVLVTATVTYFRSYENLLFVQDGDVAIYVNAPANLKLAPGDRVLIRGTAHESFRSYIQASEITLLHHGAPPAPVAATFRQMIRGEVDCRRVRVRALIRSAEIVPSSLYLVPDIALRMLVDGQQAVGEVDGSKAEALKPLLDAEAEVTGVASGYFDNKMEQTGVLFHIQSLKDVRIVRRSKTDPWSLPLTPMDRVITGYGMIDLTQRVRVRGTVTYDQPGTGVVLEDGSRALWINADSFEPLRVGDLADATGFPDVQNGFLSLTRSQVQDSGTPSRLRPAVSTWGDLAKGGNSSRGHEYDLVSIEGEVIADVRQATQDEYLLEANGHLVSAIYRHPGSLSRMPLPAMKEVPAGARVRVTGICMLADADPFMGDVPFSILLRTFDDVQVITRPAWLNVRHLLYLVSLLLAAICAVGAWSWRTERRMRRQTAIVAESEQRRSRILEAMNASHSLTEILEDITELVSFQLRGAACWCELADHGIIGRRPSDSETAQGVQRRAISGSPGAPGAIVVVSGEAEAQGALARAAQQIALAIETSRLHADLVHRSEFDLLTDIRNRFSLERSIDALIESAPPRGAVFGLIYIDLNEFKSVNDRYGHRTGDLYLQNVAARMGRQLRPGDILARLGGDEFAVLAPHIRGRGDVEEIAQRLQRSFADPFSLEGTTIRGSVSIGMAMYPEDSATKDGLLTVADAAMYAVKRQRRSVGQGLTPAV
jgi:diguanylate cyclase (GGDEF)-like protein